MNTLSWIILATILTTLLGLVGLFSLLIKKRLLERITLTLIALSAGTLMGGAFFHLITESLETHPPLITFSIVIVGFIAFFLIEGFFHWHHCERSEGHPFTYMMLVGDAIHNVIDGLVIAASFIVNVPLGVITTLMILAHELPQELGLFGVLIYGHHNRNKAIVYSVLAQSTVIVGGLLGYLLSSNINTLSTFLVPFAAGGFLYISASDLIPEIHKIHSCNFNHSFKSLIPFTIGIILMILFKVFLE